ncbi:hypothetical protein BDR05DRAFT_953249 [Suillus weaverae]|nr:hypothetical protein BDR05DRAFT_953249 [Suillus weaverae]
MLSGLANSAQTAVSGSKTSFIAADITPPLSKPLSPKPVMPAPFSQGAKKLTPTSRNTSCTFGTRLLSPSFPFQLVIMLTGLLHSNHITYHFSKGTLPRQVRFPGNEVVFHRENMGGANPSSKAGLREVSPSNRLALRSLVSVDLDSLYRLHICSCFAQNKIIGNYLQPHQPSTSLLFNLLASHGPMIALWTHRQLPHPAQDNFRSLVARSFVRIHPPDTLASFADQKVTKEEWIVESSTDCILRSVHPYAKMVLGILSYLKILEDRDQSDSEIGERGLRWQANLSGGQKARVALARSRAQQVLREFQRCLQAILPLPHLRKMVWNLTRHMRRAPPWPLNEPQAIVEGKAPRKLVEDEKRCISRDVWELYVKSCGTYGYWAWFLSILVLGALCPVAENWWLNTEEVQAKGPVYYFVIMLWCLDFDLQILRTVQRVHRFIPKWVEVETFLMTLISRVRADGLEIAKNLALCHQRSVVLMKRSIKPM